MFFKQREIVISKVARHIVQQLDLEAGESVLLLCNAGRFDELVPHVRYEVMRAGGVDLGCLEVLSNPYPGEWARSAMSEAGSASLRALKKMLADIDATVMLPGAWPNQPAYAAVQALLREGQGRAVHFHWHGAYDLTGEGLTVDERISRTYQKALLETDYEALVAAQEAFEAAARLDPIRVTTPAGTDIRFRIGDRHVTRQDGNASAARAARARVLIDREVELPAGAIRVAPLEESVEGVIVFPTSEWNQERVLGLTLEFRQGKVVSVAARQGEAAVRAELESGGEAAHSFREFALGFHPLLAVPQDDPWIPYYGYGAGVVRLSLGDNSELGGSVVGDYVRWNFFSDATVTVGGVEWVRNGRMVR